MALNHWIRTESLSHKKEYSLASPEASDTRLPNVHKNCCVWHRVSRTPEGGK